MKDKRCETALAEYEASDARPMTMGEKEAFRMGFGAGVVELEKELTSRELSMTVWTGQALWVVWLFCADDAELGTFTGSGETLDEAVQCALAAWDGKYPESKGTN